MPSRCASALFERPDHDRDVADDAQCELVSIRASFLLAPSIMRVVHSDGQDAAVRQSHGLRTVRAGPGPAEQDVAVFPIPGGTVVVTDNRLGTVIRPALELADARDIGHEHTAVWEQTLAAKADGRDAPDRKLPQRRCR